MTTQKFNPEMLTLAREFRGMTQRELAELAGLSQSLISHIEASTREITRDGSSALAKALRIPESFLYQDETYSGFGISLLFFRKRASALVGNLRRLQAEVNLRRIHAKRLLRGVDVSTPKTFEFYDIESRNCSPEDVAMMVRASWNMPLGPVKNLVGVIEEAGGIVFRFPFGTPDVDAMSIWPDDTPPLFFINSNAPADRVRFSLAHELGHVVMHDSATEDIENQANRFAAEFMMPARDIIGDLHGMTLARAAALKSYWKMSMAALIYRAKELGALSENEYRNLFVRIGQLGMRKKEEYPLKPEIPSMISQVIEVYIRDNQFTMNQIGELLLWPAEEIGPLYLPATGLRIAG